MKTTLLAALFINSLLTLTSIGLEATITKITKDVYQATKPKYLEFRSVDDIKLNDLTTLLDQFPRINPDDPYTKIAKIIITDWNVKDANATEDYQNLMREKCAPLGAHAVVMLQYKTDDHANYSVAGFAIRFDNYFPGPKITNTLGMKLTYIEPGKFMMGSPGSEKGHTYKEPHHPVTLTKGFYLGQTEVTQGQWEAVMGTRPWEGGMFAKINVVGPNYPAKISWYDAMRFCHKLSQLEGKKYHLPTEAQWEYACRAGTTTAYHFGESSRNLPQFAWYSKNRFEQDEKSYHFVGLKKPNAWGLFDMHGNASEWCLDNYSSRPTGAIDPQGPDSGTRRVARGGGCYDDPANLRSAKRSWAQPQNRTLHGFRVLLEAEEEPLP